MARHPHKTAGRGLGHTGYVARILALLLMGACSRTTITVDAGEAPADAADAAPQPRRLAFGIVDARLVDLEATAAGGFVTLLDPRQPVGDPRRLAVQRFDAWAEPVGERLPLYETSLFTPNADLTALPDGGFAAAHEEGRAPPVPTRVDFSVRLRRFDADGRVTSGSVHVYGDEWRPRLVTLRAGGYALSTQVWAGEGGAGPLRLRVFDAGGGPRRERDLRAGCGAPFVSSAGFDLVCEDEEGALLARFDGQGQPLGTPVRLAMRAPAEPVDAIAPGPGGERLVGSAGFARRFDGAGEPLGAWQTFAWPGAEPWLTRLVEAGCREGPCGYWALWLDEPESATFRPRARRLDALGVPEEDAEVLLAANADVLGPRAWYGDPHAAASAYGQSVLAWSATDLTPDLRVSVEGVLIVE
mgnify:CR=1 FL=1